VRAAPSIAIRFDRPLTPEDEERAFSALRQHWGDDAGYSRLSNNRLVVINYRGDDGLPFMMSDDDFAANLNDFRQQHGGDLGVTEMGKFGSEGQYGPAHDWSPHGPEPDGPLLPDGVTGRPDLHAWVRDRRAAFEALVERWSGERLQAAEREAGGAGRGQVRGSGAAEAAPEYSLRGKDDESTHGPFGPISRDFRHNWRDAALWLEQHGTGEAVGAPRQEQKSRATLRPEGAGVPLPAQRGEPSVEPQATPGNTEPEYALRRDRDQGDLFPGTERRPIWFSQLTRNAEQLPQAKGSPEQMLAMLRKGAKPEELAWSGVEDWLRQQKGSVTKQQLIDYLRAAHEVRVDEVEHGGGTPKPLKPRELLEVYAELNGIGTKIGNLRIELRQLGAHAPGRGKMEQQLEDLRARCDELAHRAGLLEDERAEAHDDWLSKPPPPTQYDRHTLPGAKPGSYRELLLTLPERQQIGEIGPRGWAEAGNPRSAAGDANYHSPHWDEPKHHRARALQRAHRCRGPPHPAHRGRAASRAGRDGLQHARRRLSRAAGARGGCVVKQNHPAGRGGPCRASAGAAAAY
jgi:hypothetical protein